MATITKEQREQGTAMVQSSDYFGIAMLVAERDRLKRDRDALLAVARHAHIYLVQSDDPDKRELADELWVAIKESEKP